MSSELAYGNLDQIDDAKILNLSDIIELEYTNSRNKKKDPSVWIIEKDFISRILYEINSCGFEFHEIRKIEKINKKESK